MRPEEIFNDALELPSAERTAFLEESCAGDPELRREVESLLTVAEDAPDLLRMNDASPVPERLGRFKVHRLIGQGGMGIVYEGEDPTLGRRVALKMVPTPWLRQARSQEDRQRARARIEEEARLLATLNHPQIATIHALEYEGETPFLVMEYVEGRNLAELLREETLDLKERLRICRQIAAAMEAAHAKGIVHRDLKPGNVMVTLDGKAKVLDFGIAKMLDPSGLASAAPIPAVSGAAPELTQTFSRGTPGYMSPEQVAGAPVGPKADIWAYGRVLCDCFALDPSPESGGGPAGPSAKGLNAHLRRHLERLARRCLMEDAALRPPSFAEVGQEVDGIVREQARFRRLRKWWPAWAVPVCALAVFALLKVVALSKAYPIAVRPSGTDALVRMSDDREVLFAAPESCIARLDTALVVAAGPRPQDRLVIGGQALAGDRLAGMLCWSGKGRLLAAIRPTGDCPYPEDSGQGDFREKWIQLFWPPSVRRSTMDIVDYAHYFPSVLRRYRLAPDSVQEIYRLYHAGHIDQVLDSRGLFPGSHWTWISGSIRNGDVLRQAARGREGASYFLACVETSHRGTEVFPLYEAPDPEFAPAVGDSARIASPILYLVLKRFEDLGQPDSWTAWGSTYGMWLDEVFDQTPGRVSVLLVDAIRLDFSLVDPASVHLQASMSGDNRRLIEQRQSRQGALLQGAAADAYVQKFLADSVVVLAHARSGLTVTGDFTDIRGKLPPMREGRTVAGRPGG